MSDTRPPLLSLDDALQRLLQGAAGHAITETETVSTFDGLGRVLAAEVRSALDVPSADNSSMDGYALRAADAAVGTLLPVAQRIAVPSLVLWGSRDQTLAPASFPKLAASLPNAQTATIKAGHVPHQSHAEEFNRFVLEFLQTVDRGQ